jgi:hypothetical protein
MVKNFISEIKKLKSKLKKYEDKLSKSKDIDKVLYNELKIDIYKEKINKLISKNISINTHIKDYDNINNFDNVIFWVTIDNQNAEFGGNSSLNDCFWFCINNGIPQYNPWKKPEDLKEFLGLRRRDLIGLKDIERIEKKIGKVGINVSGDCYYISKIAQTKNAFYVKMIYFP